MGRHSYHARHDDAADTARSPWRVAVLTVLALTLLATVAGLFSLWPQADREDLFSEDFSRTYALNHPQVAGHVEHVDGELCSSPVTGKAFTEPPIPTGINDTAGCRRAVIRLDEGEDAGAYTQLVHWNIAGDPVLEVGDKIVLSESTNPESTNPDATRQYSFADYQRGNALAVWAAVVAVVIIVFAAWHGLRSLVGLAYSLAVVFFFLLPALMEGGNPVAVTLTACSAIVLVAIPLVHGVNWKSAAALCATLIALVLAAFIARWGINSTQLQGFSNEDNLKLLLYLPSVSILGMLFSGFVIGAVGGLNDVAIAQASTVTELAAADPDAGPLALFLSAMKVGRDHIASMVYTLVLSYTGAALPLLMLITAAQRPVGQILSSDILATELLRSGVGALALTLAVPLTTLLAALVVRPAR